MATLEQFDVPYLESIAKPSLSSAPTRSAYALLFLHSRRKSTYLRCHCYNEPGLTLVTD